MEREPRDLALDARAASLKLRVLPSEIRAELLEKLAEAVEKRQGEILQKNDADVQRSSGASSTRRRASDVRKGQVSLRIPS